MISISVPGLGEYEIHHLVLDVNGTIALDGRLLPGVSERLRRLRHSVELHLVTADTHGNQAAIDSALGTTAVRITPVMSQTRKADTCAP